MIKVIKIGGNVVDDPKELDSFLKKFASIPGDKILVHGGGKVATTISDSLGIETVMIEGRRVTDMETIKVVTMVFAGLINKTIVGSLNRKGVTAWGVCGADGKIMVSKKRDNSMIDYGYVGDPIVEQVNVHAVKMLLDGGFVPVIAPITVDQDGILLNTNADTVAQTIAVALSKIDQTELIYCFEKDGVLRDSQQEESVIETISLAEYEQLKSSKQVYGGMIPKIDNAFQAISCGVECVYICNSKNIDKENYNGTKIV